MVAVVACYSMCCNCNMWSSGIIRVVAVVSLLSAAAIAYILAVVRVGLRIE